MRKDRKKLVTQTFRGPRFEDHGVDVDVLPELVAYKNLLVETAKELWRAKNPDRQRLPRNFADSLVIKFYEVRDNCVTIPLERVIDVDESLLPFPPQQDELDEAVALVTDTIGAAAADAPFPEAFPSKLLTLFDNYGKTLRDDERIEHLPPDRKEPVVYTSTVHQRIVERTAAPYEDVVDITGSVTMARVSKPRMALLLPNGREVEAAFSPQDEETIITALKEHATAKLRVEGRAVFSAQGVVEKITQVDRVTFLRAGELEFDAAAKPIWDDFDEVLAGVPADEFATLPHDGAEHHDHYIYGTPKKNPS